LVASKEIPMSVDIQIAAMPVAEKIGLLEGVPTKKREDVKSTDERLGNRQWATFPTAALGTRRRVVASPT
jgi:hypothetical protein